jgi:hypothetical protein
MGRYVIVDLCVEAPTSATRSITIKAAAAVAAVAAVAAPSDTLLAAATSWCQMDEPSLLLQLMSHAPDTTLIFSTDDAEEELPAHASILILHSQVKTLNSSTAKLRALRLLTQLLRQTVLLLLTADHGRPQMALKRHSTYRMHCSGGCNVFFTVRLCALHRSWPRQWSW